MGSAGIEALEPNRHGGASSSADTDAGGWITRSQWPPCWCQWAGQGRAHISHSQPIVSASGGFMLWAAS